jgi:hypothetical protein
MGTHTTGAFFCAADQGVVAKDRRRRFDFTGNDENH